MAELVKLNKKVINDPLYSPVERFLLDRIASLEINDPDGELPLARQRYDGIVAGDLVIENPTSFPDGAIRVCFVSRKTGFARVDVDIKRVEMKDILEDFAVPMVVINDIENLKTFVKSNTEQAVLLWLEYKQTYGVLLTQKSATTHYGPMEAFGNLFFEKITTTRESLTSIDYETLESGTVRIDDVSFGLGEYPLFIQELALDEALLPEITSNLPASITTRRGQTFEIPNTYWLGGVQDITLTAEVTLSTNSGYTIPVRSDNLLFIDGETIYGSATQDMEDVIVVRVTQEYNGKLVRKTFRINVLIEKDIQTDLVITTNPTDVVAVQGDTVEVVVTATYKGDVVRLLIPPTTMRSQKNFGGLAYVKTNPDYTMIYRGTVTGVIPGNDEGLTDLWSAQFEYTSGAENIQAMGYVSLLQKRQEAKPKFSVNDVPTTIQGYVGATGVYMPTVLYGNDTVPLSECHLTSGVQGSRSLIDFTQIDDKEGISWKLVNNSGIPGTPIRDIIAQVYTWKDPGGTVHEITRNIEVTVKLDSVYEVVAAGQQPRKVVRNQMGGPTFNLMVNGVARNNLISNMHITPQPPVEDMYIVDAPEAYPNRWMVVKADKTEKSYTVTFTFQAIIDEKVHDFSYTQEFLIAKYPPDKNDPNTPEIPVDDTDPDNPGSGKPAPGETGTGPGGPDPIDDIDGPGDGEGPYNMNLTMLPTSFTMAGDSDKAYKMTFKVLEGANDVTADTKILDSETVVPDNIRFTKLAYVASKNCYQLDYYKDGGSNSVGKIFAAKKDAVNPTKADIARLYITSKVTQIKILKIIDNPGAQTLDIDVPKDVKIGLQFSGVDLKLTDPNLTITNTSAALNDTKITAINDDAITLLDTYWRYVGRNLNETLRLKIDYKDPEDGTVYTVNINLAVTVQFPYPEVVYTGEQEIDAKMWDTGTFPLKLMAGTRDITPNISSVTLVSGSKYLKNSKLDWEVIFAEKEATTQIVGLSIFYQIGDTSASIPADFKFNFAAWDGITFAVTSFRPEIINGKAGTDTKYQMGFRLVYKGQDWTEQAAVMFGECVIPNTMVLTDGVQNAGDEKVILYKLQNGGKGEVKIVFAPYDDPDVTIRATQTIPTDVEWPYDLNIENKGTSIRGFYDQEVEFPLVLNFNSVPLPLDDANLTITVDSGEGDPIVQNGQTDTGLTMHLVEGGDKNTNYNYTVKITLVYVDPTSGASFTKELSIPAVIRVSNILITNPVLNVNTYDRGEIPIVLKDEQGNVIPMTSLVPRGQGDNVVFVAPKNWYITTGSKTAALTGTLPLTVTYDYAGKSYSENIDETFNIAIWDGKKFVVKAAQTTFKGNAGDAGDDQLTITYLGDPVVGAELDVDRSDIPGCIGFGEITADNTLPWSLIGNDSGDGYLIITRPDGAVPGVEDLDFAKILISAESKSSNEPFTIDSYDNRFSLDWGKEGFIAVAMTYGTQKVYANTPGATFTIRDAANAGLKITRRTKDGIYFAATKSAPAGSVSPYPIVIDVTYDVGGPTLKTGEMDVTGTVNMGPAAISRNDVIAAAIWSKGSLRQIVQFNGVTLDTIDHFEIRNGAENKYVEITPPRGYEIIGAEVAESTQVVPMTVYYKVDTTSELQKLNFDASFKIPGSTSVRFKVIPTPDNIASSVGNDNAVNFLPVYKDKNVGSAAVFKQDLMVLPEFITLKSVANVGANYVLTFTGVKPGVGKAKFVFWSPDAGTNPKARDIVELELDVRCMGELGLEIGNRDNLLTGKSGDTGTYDLEILFGGIPIDTAAEIAAGNLTATVEVGAATSMNANVLKVDSWGQTDFTYDLAGPVVPGQTVAVSDYINLSYKYGSQSFTRRVEIPMSYTTSAPVIESTSIPNPVNVFATGTYSMVMTCDGVNISSTWISSSNADEDKYVELSGKTFNVIWGETTQLAHTVKANVVGKYRQWAFAVDTDLPFVINAWNQKTWDPTMTITSASGYVGSQVVTQVKATYKGAGNQQLNRDVVDLSMSDLKGLATLTYWQSGNNGTVVYYYLKAINPGKDTLKVCLRRPNSPVPGVENEDYTYFYVDVDYTADELVVTGPSSVVSGGNGDTIAAAGLVVRRKSNNAQVSNIATGMIIKVVDENIFKINSLAASAMNITVTAPYTMADGPVTVPMTFEWQDTVNNQTLKGTFNYPITLTRPADWPVAVQTASSTTNLKLWDYGPIPFKVTSGSTDISSQAVPTSCVDDSPGQGDPAIADQMQLSLNQPIAGTWWWIVNRNYGATNQVQTRTSKWKLNVPYRGDTISIDANFVYRRIGDGTGIINEFQGSTTQAKTLMQDVGDQADLPFSFLYRGYKTGDVTFNPTLSGTDSAKFSDYFKVVSKTYDDSTGITTLKIEMTAVYQGTMNFVWDRTGFSDGVDGKTRVSIVTSFYDLAITNLNNNDWAMWNRRALNTLVSIKDGDTELVTTSRVISISNAILIPDSTGNNTYVRAVSDVATAAFTGNIVYTIQLPAAYSNRQIKVTLPSTIAAYDGNELVVSVQSYNNPIAVTGAVNNQCYFNMSYRGNGVSFANRASTAALLNSVNENDNSLLFGTIGQVTPSNWIYYSFGSRNTRTGKIKLPIRYTGTMETAYPTDTLGKNLAILELDCRFFEPKLYFYPDDKIPDQVTGETGKTVAIPMQFTVGLNFTDLLRAPNAAGMTWSIIGSTMSGVVSKPASSFVTATGINLQIDFDNRGDDIVVDVPLRMNYTNGTVGSANTTVNSNRDWTQKVLIKGTNAGDTITATPAAFTSTLVWNVYGPAATIVQNGKTITASQITDIQIAPNPYIRRPETSPNFTNRWFEIYDGKTDDKTQTTATFTITYNDGVRSQTVTVDVPITIEKYSGSPWKVVPVAIVSQSQANLVYNDGLSGSAGNVASGYLQVTYKNVGITTNNGSQYTIFTGKGSNLPGFSGITNKGSVWQVTQGNSHTYEFLWQYAAAAGANQMDMPEMGYLYFGLAAKENDPTAVEGVDYIKVPVPCFVYTANAWVITEGPSTLEGKFGDPNAKLPFRMRQNNVYASTLLAMGATVLVNPGNLKTVTGLSDAATAVTTTFGADISTPKDVRDVVFWFGPTTNNLVARKTVKVTQNSTLEFPVVSNVQPVTAGLNESGAVPFKVASADGATDVTSTVVVTAVSTNDYIGIKDGKWWVKNARSGDTTVTVTLTFTAVYKGNTVTMTQDVVYTVKAFDGKFTVSNVQSLKGDVWTTYTSMPFDISVNGSAIPASWITANTGASPNSRVTVGPEIGKSKIISGDNNQDVVEVVTWTVSITVGTNSWTITQAVTYNINKYDGIEFKLNLANLQAGNKELQAIFLAYNATSTNGIYFEGRYRGDLVPSPVGVSLSGGYLRIGNGPINGASYVAWAVQPSGAPARATANWTARIKRASSAGTIENSDIASLVVPTYFVVGAGDMFVHTGTTKAISGKKGDNLDLVLNMFRYSGNPTTTTLTDLTVGSTTVEFSPANVIEMVPGSITKNGYKVRYVNTLYVDTQTTVTATVKTSTGNVTYTIDVTQLASPADQPDVADNNGQTASINQTGTLPFKLVDPDTKQDVTSAATITSIGSNDYVELVDGKWHVKKDVAADTHSNVTFNLALNYRNKDITVAVIVDFLIKPFDGKFVIAAVPDISAKVWENGATIPLSITVNGNPMPSSWITGYAASPTNQYVTVATDGTWQVVDGSKDAAVSQTVGYAANITFPGGTTAQAIANVKFNIAKYDGIELVAKLVNAGGGNANVQSVFYPYNATSTVGIIYQLYSKGKLVTNAQYAGGANVGPENTLSLGTISAVGSNVTLNLKGTGKADRNTQTSVSLKIKIGGTAGTTEGIDVVSVVTPVFMVAGTGQLLVHPRTTTSMSGKYGTPVSLDAFVIKYVTDTGSTFADLTTGNTAVTFAPNDVISLVPDSFTPQGYKVNFINKLYTDTVTPVTVTLTNGGVSTRYVLNVTQLASSDDRPKVDARGVMDPVAYGEVGSITLAGTVGSDPLANKVTFVPGSSDAKGLVQFGDPVNNANGTVSIPVTGIKVGKDNLTIHITVNGATGNVSGVDYLDVSVPAEVTYAELAESEDFQTSGTGYSTENLTLTQSVILPAE